METKTKKPAANENENCSAEVYRICVYEDGTFSVITPTGKLSSKCDSVIFKAEPAKQPSLKLIRGTPIKFREEASPAEKAVAAAHMSGQRSRKPSATGVLPDNLYPLDSLQREFLIDHSELRNTKPSKLVPLTHIGEDGANLKLKIPTGEDDGDAEVLDVPIVDVEAVDIPVVASDSEGNWTTNDPDHIKQAILEIAGAENILSTMDAVLVVSQIEQPVFSLLNPQTGQFNISETLRVWFMKDQMDKERLELAVVGAGERE